MPESTCLHIQDHESAPIRVVDIPWISVRIGRAAFCEVRLTSDDLADEACRLYRRGRSWHLVPAGARSKNKIMLDGRPVDASRPLPYDVPFQIGSFCLTLRQDRAAQPDWGTYPGTTPANRGWSTPALDQRPDGRGREPRVDLVDLPQATVDAAFEREWRAHGATNRPNHGARPPAAASVKDRWEARWRVAGAELKARAERAAPRTEPGPGAGPSGFESVPLKEPAIPRAQPVQRPRVAPPARPIARTHDAALANARHFAHPAAPVENRSPLPHIEDAWVARAEPPQALRSPFQHPDMADDNDNDDDDVTVGPVSELEHPALAADVDEPRPEADDESWYEMPVPAPAQEPEPEPKAYEPLLELGDRAAIFARPETAREFPATEPITPRPASVRGRKRGDRKKQASARPHIDREPGPATGARPEPEPQAKPDQWPSAKDILACHRPISRAQPGRVPGARPGALTGLTHPREPAQWTLPAWLAGPLASVFLLAVGLIGGLLSWWWASDAYAVAFMTARLVQTDGRAPRGPLADSVAPPDGTWARTTAQHLAHWAIFMSRDEQGQPSSPREVAALLDRALQISPLNPTARLAIAQLEPLEIGVPVSRRALGLSRDAVSLAWCARRMLAAGDKDGALKMFEKALKIATPDEPSRAAVARFSDDPNVPRYLLPGEEQVQEIVREMVAKNAWPFSEWSAALPRNPTTLLAAARLLKKQGMTEAEPLLDLVLDDRVALGGKRTPGALATAARAEAFALKSRWRESEEHYRLAIDLVDDDTIKRSWWFNLADIESKLDDETQSQTALRAAMTNASDDIAHKATLLQRAAGGRPLSRSSGPKAN